MALRCVTPRALALTAPLLAVAVAAWSSGSLTSELGAFEDEPAHVATALMLRDWLASGDFAQPVRFAEEMYRYHPKVAIGQWPPVLHGALALWTLALGAKAAAIALFGWVVCAGAALLTTWVTGRVLLARGAALGPAWLCAGAAGLTFAALPLTRELAGAAMTEVPMALLGTAAALAFGAWLDQPSVRRALGFGVLAVSAILTKGSGLALALVPPAALLLARRPRAALERSLWVAPLAVGVLAAPWYALSLSMVRTTWKEGSSPSLEFTRRAFEYYPGALLDELGAPLAALAAVGAVALALRPTPRGAALLGWLMALAVLHATVPSSLEARHLVVAAPALAIVAAVGAHTLASAVGRAPGASAAALTVIAGAFALDRPVRKEWHGFAEAAALVRAEPAAHGDSVLVASGATGEGLGVLAFALSDEPRRTRQVLRASKVLASASWIGDGYITRFQDPEGVRAWLAAVPVGVVLLDRATPPMHQREHLSQLAAALAGAPEVWHLAARFDVWRDGARFPEALEVWLAPTHLARPARALTFDEVRAWAQADGPALD